MILPRGPLSNARVCQRGWYCGYGEERCVPRLLSGRPVIACPKSKPKGAAYPRTFFGVFQLKAAPKFQQTRGAGHLQLGVGIGRLLLKHVIVIAPRRNAWTLSMADYLVLLII